MNTNQVLVILCFFILKKIYNVKQKRVSLTITCFKLFLFLFQDIRNEI